MVQSIMRHVTMLLAGLQLAGCSARPVNPSLAVSESRARSDLRQMANDPKSLDRPLIVLAGWLNPGNTGYIIEQDLKQYFTDNRITYVSFAECETFDECRHCVITSVDRTFPTDNPRHTTEVDVIAFSMGGLVARYAADTENEAARYLKIKRLFTIATPHRGAAMADWPALDQLQRDMRPDSAFITNLDESLQFAEYEIIPYVRLGDEIIGAANAAPPDRIPWWLPNIPMSLAHHHAHRDPRIIADIVRQLRNENRYGTPPPAPLPRGRIPSRINEPAP